MIGSRLSRLPKKALGKLNILINNAGIIERHSLKYTTVLFWKRVIGINSMGVFYSAKMLCQRRVWDQL
jgi:NAD(P)-dependent dehydrogenase (short-subunit alcohol dehydrogenase family)